MVGWGLGKGSGFWKLGHVICNILDLSALLGMSYVHVLRDQNCLVDKLTFFLNSCQLSENIEHTTSHFSHKCYHNIPICIMLNHKKKRTNHLS